MFPVPYLPQPASPETTLPASALHPFRFPCRKHPIVQLPVQKCSRMFLIHLHNNGFQPMQRCPMDKWFPLACTKKPLPGTSDSSHFSGWFHCRRISRPMWDHIADTMVHLQDWHQTHGRSRPFHPLHFLKHQNIRYRRCRQIYILSAPFLS